MLSIVTPVLNGAEFIENNIISIKKLNIPFEHIVVDGGSNDATVEIVKRYPHIKLLLQKDKTGMYGAIHQGFLEAANRYLTWVNCDDIILAENFEKAVKKAHQDDCDFVYGDGYYLWQESHKKNYIKGNPFGKYFLKAGILPFAQPSSFYKKDIYLQVGLRYEDFRICGDLDLFSRIALMDKAKFKYIRKPLTVFLKYGDSLGDRNYELYLEERKKLLFRPSELMKFIFRITRFF